MSPAGWRLSPEESPGGGLTGAGLHVLDAFVSMMGPVHRVYAQLRRAKQGPPPLDTAVMTLDFANGVTGTLATVRATPLYWRVHVFGTKGSAEVLDEATMILRKTGSEPQRTSYPAIDVLRAELDAFADAVDWNKPVSGAGSRDTGDAFGVRGGTSFDDIRRSGYLR